MADMSFLKQFLQTGTVSREKGRLQCLASHVLQLIMCYTPWKQRISVRSKQNKIGLNIN